MPTAVSRLLERELELGAVAGLVRSATEGSGRATLIEGEAGIGKTALLSAAGERASEVGVEVLTARGGELESEFAWGLVRQLFDGPVGRASTGDRSRLLGGAAALAQPALGIEAVERTVDPSYATLHGLYWLTVNLAEQRPLLLVVDDVHWADAPSLRFVAHLLPRIADLPIAVLLASRPRTTQDGPGAELLARIAAEPTLSGLRPAGLSPAASVALVRERLSGEVGEEVCLACHELTRVNPFLLQALIAELRGDAGAPGDVTVEHVRKLTPATVSATVLLRLARLPSGSLALARAVAILGNDAPLHTAARLAGLELDEAVEHAGALIHAGIFTEDDALAFVHPLVRSAVYRDLAPPERSRWHHRAARVLGDESAPLERIAPHLMQSAPAGEQWTVDQLRGAAADAWAGGAPDVAVGFLRRALAEPPGKAARGETLFELGQVELVQDPALAIADLSEGLETLEGSHRRAEAALVLGEGLTLVGRLADAIPVLGAALADLDGDGSTELRSSLEAARLGAARWDAAAQELRRDLVRAIRDRAAAGEQLDARLHAQLAIEASAEGFDRDAAVHHARMALTASERPAGAAISALPEAMLVLLFADHADEAQKAVDEWLALARSRAWPLAAMLGATVATLASLYRGAVSDAVASAWDAVTPHAEIRIAPVTIGFLVEALLERGEIDAARSELANRDLDGEVPYAWATTPLLLARGRLHAAAGDHASAVEDLLDSGRRAEAWGVRNPAMHPWRSSAAVSLAQLGQRERAVQLADEEVELARRWEAPRAIGVALRAAGIAHGGDAGVALLRDATAVLESSTAPLEHARALTDLGSALRRAGHRRDARDQLRAGLELAHRLGAVAVADRARDELTIAGARPRRDALRGRDALTPSELRVARLAAGGRSNREIAEALFVTLRTVEAHLTSSYGKLGISSRQELAAALGTSSP